MLKGIFGRLVKWLGSNKLLMANSVMIAVLLSTSAVQFNVGAKGRSIGMVTIRLGSADDALAAGTVDYTYNGTNDNIPWQNALNALPASGGMLVDVSGVTKHFAAPVTRAIGNVTIVGTGRGSYFTNNGAAVIFQPGGNNWVFKDMAFDSLNGINQGVTTGWIEENIWLGTLHYAFRSTDGETVAGSFSTENASVTNFVNSPVPDANATRSWGSSIKKWLTGWFVNLVTDTLNATQVTGVTGNYSTLNAPTGRGATIVVATDDAQPQEKAQADYILPASGSGNVTGALIAYFNHLPLTTGSTGNVVDISTRTGVFKVIGQTLALDDVAYFPPFRNGIVDLSGLVSISGNITVWDSMMNAQVLLAPNSGSFNGSCLIWFPRTAGPDKGVFFNAVHFYIYNNSANTTYGFVANSSVVDFFHCSITIKELVANQNTPYFVPATWGTNGNQIMTPGAPQVCSLTTSTNTSIAQFATVALNWTTETYDPSNLHSANSSNITIQVPGFYRVTGQATWNTTVNDTMLELGIRVNGSTVYGRTRTYNPILHTTNATTFAVFQQCTASIYLNVGDKVELVARPMDTPVAIIGATPPTSFWLERIDY